MFKKKIKEDDELTSLIREVLINLKPDVGALIIKTLHININYASGGGATITVLDSRE